MKHDQTLADPAGQTKADALSVAFVVELAQRIEWEGDKAAAICPECHGWQLFGHEKACRLDALITQFREHCATHGITIAERDAKADDGYAARRRAFDATEAGRIYRERSTAMHRYYAENVADALARGVPVPRMEPGAGTVPEVRRPYRTESGKLVWSDARSRDQIPQ